MLVKTRQAQDMKMKKNKKCSFQVNFFFISIKLILISFFFYGIKPVFSQCSCQCVSGRVQPVCSKAPKMMPICPPRICNVVAPKARILKRLVPPPPKIKPSNCQQRRVKNPNTNQYIWRTVCRPDNSFQ